nr:uncharacterized protein LOC127336392 [Lolium perenne]
MSIYGTVPVKLFIDKVNKKVLFAESDKDFVDILFSFLTLPLGTIVRRLGKQSQLGCLDELYKSVESLSEDHFQTKACKSMLLRPVNAAAFQCDRLKVQIDDENSRRFYVCCASNCKKMTPVKVNYCNCGSGTSSWECPHNVFGTVEGNDDGTFLKSGLKFIVTDDLQVSPASTTLVFSLLDRFGLQEQAKIEEKIFQLNAHMIISLLQRASLSKQPLTGLYFDVPLSQDAVNIDQLPKIPKQGDGSFFAIKIKLVHTKDDSSELYAEVGEDFVDLIFGLLCFPLGSVIRTYGQMSPNGCIGNLYNSIDGSANGCVKSECEYLLRTPKLAPFFGCSRDVLQAEELCPRRVTSSCLKCYRTTSQVCTTHTKPLSATVKEMNPKYADNESYYNNGKAYIKGGPRNFLVTDDLRVIHFSLTNTLQVMRAAKVPKEELVEKQLSLDKTQVMKLVRAALVTRGALSSVLLPPKK